MKILSFVSLAEVKKNLKPGDIIDYKIGNQLEYREIFIAFGQPDKRFLECETFGILKNSYKDKLTSIGISASDLKDYEFYIF